jgi:hypothetical protein
MSGADDTEMVPTSVVNVDELNAKFGSSDDKDSSGDDEDSSTVARQNITKFEAKLGPVCYDLIQNIWQFINNANRTGKVVNGYGKGSFVTELTASLIREEITIKEPGVFNNPLTGYGMICICKTPRNKQERMAQYKARDAVTLIAKSVCKTERPAPLFNKHYPEEDQFVTIDNIANFDHVRGILSQGELGNHLVFVYFNTTGGAQEIKFNVSDLGIDSYFIGKLNYAFGMKNETITIEPHTSITRIYGASFAHFEYPGMDIESLPSNPHLWGADHVLYWLSTKGLDATFATDHHLTGELIVMYKDLPLVHIQDDMQCTLEKAAELQEACRTVAGPAALENDAGMDWQSAFTDLCIQR